MSWLDPKFVREGGLVGGLTELKGGMSMKKWYVIIGALVLLLLVGMGGCLSNSDEVSILKGEVRS